MPEFFDSRNFKVGVEVGVFRAEYGEVLAKGNYILYEIDPWKAYKDTNDQDLLDTYKDISYKALAKYPNVAVLEEESMEAVKRFPEESIDFAYIDGNHMFKWIAEDIYEWWLRLKKGGVLAGHDYAKFEHREPKRGCQVKEVVDAFASSYDYNFWVLGKRGEVDRYRSWMFIKE